MMSNLKDIYRGYLDLILRLESIYIGGVETCPTNENPLYLLRISPTTPASVQAVILPACEKFNALKSTPLDVAVTDDEATIYSKAIAPVVYVMHRHVQRYRRAQQGMVSDKLRIATGLEYLKYILELQLNGQSSLGDLRDYHRSLEHYDRYCKSGKEGADLFHALTEGITKEEKIIMRECYETQSKGYL